MSWKHAAQEIGVSPQIISNMKTARKRQSVTVDMLIGLTKNIRRINLRWILLGEGEMLVDKNEIL